MRIRTYTPFRTPLLLVLLATLFVLAACSSSRRTPKEERTARKEIKRKAIKEARKESRKLKRDGWFVAPGSLPMEKQLEYTWIQLYERDEEGQLNYISAEGNGVGTTQSAAQLQAFELAKLNLAGQLETIVRGIVKANIANQQLTQEEAVTVNRVLTTSRNIIATTLQQVEPTFVVYRTFRNANVECQVKLLYNRKGAVQSANATIRRQLEDELGELSDRWDRILNLEGADLNAADDLENARP